MIFKIPTREELEARKKATSQAIKQAQSAKANAFIEAARVKAIAAKNAPPPPPRAAAVVAAVAPAAARKVTTTSAVTSVERL
jgi:uncharacterized protein YggE